MHPVRKKKLMTYLTALLVLGVVTALIMYALRQNISLFYTPIDALDGKALVGVNMRMGGRVVPGSITHGDDLQVQFKMTDLKASILVTYRGLLPDLFRDEQGVVVEGQVLPDGSFKASRVLAKHDENYMPPEVKAALAKEVA